VRPIGSCYQLLASCYLNYIWSIADERIALFVRVPTATASRLDEVVRAAGRSKQDLVTDCIDLQLNVHEGVSVKDGSEDILTTEEVCAFLRVDMVAVEERLHAGDIPARRFGVEWRFSKAAILRWLDGNDASDHRAIGFQRGSD
jgi:excisionase family DNA binding protein